MKKLENASNNLEEILTAVVAGKEVQYWSDPDRKWQTLHNIALSFALDEDGVKLKWRVKPDAFDEAWYDALDSMETKCVKTVAKHFWTAAIKHMERSQ
jgi:hypothetical protein